MAGKGRKVFQDALETLITDVLHKFMKFGASVGGKSFHDYLVGKNSVATGSGALEEFRDNHLPFPSITDPFGESFVTNVAVFPEVAVWI